MLRRVVVTGIGTLSPVGNDAKTSWENLISGKSGIDHITQFDTDGFDVTFAGEVKDFDPTQFIDKKETRRMDRFVQFAMAASEMAMQDSGLDLEKINREKLGTIIGSGIGGLWTHEAQHKRLLEGGPGKISPFYVPMMICDMASGQVSIRYGAKGLNYATVSACTSGAHAIGDAFRWIKFGEADVIIAGGSEGTITPMCVGGFASMKALSTRNDDPESASRPFDAERDGFIIGEGAGIVILEELNHALERGASIRAEVVGYGMTADAHHITAPAPEGEGAARAMKRAIDEGGLTPTEVDYINAHGTSTPLNDKFETMAIKTVFGEHARDIAISSTKSMTGHLLGAAGAIEFVYSVQAIENNLIPPTINYTTPDPDCDLDYVPNESRKRKIRAALSNSLAFGGHNVSIAIKEYVE